MEEQTKQNLLSVDTWIRLVYMILFLILMMIARVVVAAIAVLQIITVLISGKDNQKLRELGQLTGKWIYETVSFLTFNSNQKPFPFNDWPELDTESAAPEQTSPPTSTMND